MENWITAILVGSIVSGTFLLYHISKQLFIIIELLQGKR